MQNDIPGASDSRRKGSSPRRAARRSRRVDAETNAALIESAWCTLFDANKRRPTNGQIATETGLSLTVVQRHMKNFDALAYIRDSNFKVAALRVVERLYEKIVKGDLDGFSASDVRLFLEIVAKFTPPAPSSAPPDDGVDVTITLPDNGRADHGRQIPPALPPASGGSA